MRRKIYEKLLKWKRESKGKTALLIDGARRVGKSWIAEEFARNEYASYVIVDFSKAGPKLKRIFNLYLDDLDTFFLHFQQLTRTKLVRNNALVIFDEVQKFPRAREAIKHLVADGRYHYLETGSLISINKNVRKFAIALTVLVVLLILICISLIGNTVRIAMYANRFLIKTMQLVGATNWFIRRPLIYQNIGYGLIASVIALAALAGLGWYGMSQGAFDAVADLLLHPLPIAIIVGSVVISGILIPAFAAWTSVDKYLNRKKDDLYLM